MRFIRPMICLALAMAMICLTGALAEESVLSLPNGLKLIETEAFMGDTSIEEVYIPGSVIRIGESAFSGDMNLRRVVVAEGVKKIDDYAFHGCGQLAEVVLPASVTAISWSAFDDCYGFTVQAPKGSYAYEWARNNGYIDTLDITMSDEVQGKCVLQTTDDGLILDHFTGEGGMFLASISASQTWSVETDVDWISYYNNGMGGLDLSIQANQDGPARVGTVTVTAGNAVKTIEIRQDVFNIVVDELVINLDQGVEWSRNTEVSCSDDGNTLRWDNVSCQGSSSSASFSDYYLEISPDDNTVVINSDSEWLRVVNDHNSSYNRAGWWLVFDRNETNERRTGTITFTRGETVKQLIVTQVPGIDEKPELIGPQKILESLQNSVYGPRLTLGYEDVTMIWSALENATDYRVNLQYKEQNTNSLVYREIGSTALSEDGESVIAMIPIEEMCVNAYGDPEIWLSFRDENGYRYEGEHIFFYIDPWSSFDESDENLNNWYYEKITDANTGRPGISIRDIMGGMPEEIVVPERLGGIPVTQIDGLAQNFSASDWVRSVTLPDSVTTIKGNAFNNCTGLEQFELPASLTTIESAFNGCENLAEIELPRKLASIGDAFGSCRSLTRIELPASLTSIGDYAFSGCDNLTEVTAEKGTYAYQWALNKGFITEPGSIDYTIRSWPEPVITEPEPGVRLLTMSDEGRDLELVLDTAGQALSVTYDCDWMEYEDLLGDRRLTVYNNETGETRTGTVTLRLGNIESKLVITQKAAKSAELIEPAALDLYAEDPPTIPYGDLKTVWKVDEGIVRFEIYITDPWKSNGIMYSFEPEDGDAETVEFTIPKECFDRGTEEYNGFYTVAYDEDGASYGRGNYCYYFYME